jgi:hypothetical protein
LMLFIASTMMIAFLAVPVMAVKRAARAVKWYMCAMRLLSTRKEGDGPYEPENRDSEGRTLFASF